MQYKQWLPADDMATVKYEILTDVKKRVLQDSKFVFVFVFNGINEDGKIVHFTCEPEKDPMIMRIKKDNYLTLTCTKNIEWHVFYDRMSLFAFWSARLLQNITFANKNDPWPLAHL